LQRGGAGSLGLPSPHGPRASVAAAADFLAVGSIHLHEWLQRMENHGARNSGKRGPTPFGFIMNVQNIKEICHRVEKKAWDPAGDFWRRFFHVTGFVVCFILLLLCCFLG
jgi:hypothetical protein